MSRQPGAAPEEHTLADARPSEKVAEPRLWQVLLHNDDFTTQEFVVWVLETIFRRSAPDAFSIMMHVHQAGLGIAGVYTRDVAETKIAATERAAEQQEFPLRVTMEPVAEESRT